MLTGLAYSVVGLTFAASPVYASTCDCNEALQDAYEFCANGHGGFELPGDFFSCPVEYQGQTYAVYQCSDHFINNQLCPD